MLSLATQVTVARTVDKLSCLSFIEDKGSPDYKIIKNYVLL